MKKMDYDYPVLEEALFGAFICGESPMSPDTPDDDTDDLEP